jgi:Cu/Ag efflux pump CusA
MDFLFKSYFVFFRAKKENGASAAVIGLSIPLGLLSYLIFLFAMSFLVDLKDLGGALFGLLAGMSVLLVGIALRHIYVTKERYLKLSPIKYSFIYYASGVIFYFSSIMIFLLTFVSMLNLP